MNIMYLDAMSLVGGGEDGEKCSDGETQESGQNQLARGSGSLLSKTTMRRRLCMALHLKKQQIF